jgi:hypothetical protein
LGGRAPFLKALVELLPEVKGQVGIATDGIDPRLHEYTVLWRPIGEYFRAGIVPLYIKHPSAELRPATLHVLLLFRAVSHGLPDRCTPDAAESRLQKWAGEHAGNKIRTCTFLHRFGQAALYSWAVSSHRSHSARTPASRPRLSRSTKDSTIPLIRQFSKYPPALHVLFHLAFSSLLAHRHVACGLIVDQCTGRDRQFHNSGLRFHKLPILLGHRAHQKPCLWTGRSY